MLYVAIILILYLYKVITFISVEISIILKYFNFEAFSFQNNMESTELEPQSTSIFDLNYVLNGCSNLSPDIEEDERAASPTVNMLNVNYEVTEWIGPWWKGACFRRQRKKTVLRDITVQLKSGLLTAILGNSGDMLCLKFWIRVERQHSIDLIIHVIIIPPLFPFFLEPPP